MTKKQNNVIKLLLFLISGVLVIVNENEWFIVPQYIPIITFLLGFIWGWDIWDIFW